MLFLRILFNKTVLTLINHLICTFLRRMLSEFLYKG